MGVNLRIDSIQTFEDVREALQGVKEALDGSVLAKGEWTFFNIPVLSAVTSLTYAHNLKFIPKDVIQLSVTNDVTVTWHFDSFTRTNLIISTTGATVIRAYIGRHREGSL